MAIELTPEEEALILAQRDRVSYRNDPIAHTAKKWEEAGKQMEAAGLGGPENRATPPKQGLGITWGGMVRGAKKIVKWVVVAVALTAAFMLLTQFFIGMAATSPTLAPSINFVLDYFMKPVSNAVLSLGDAGTWLSSATSSIGTGINSLFAAAGIGTAAVALNQMPDPSHSLNAIVSKKAAVMQAADPNNMMAALPDSPHELRAAAQIMQSHSAQAAHAAHASHGAETAAHVAADKTHESMAERSRSSAAERLRAAREAQALWVDRIKSPTQASITNERM